MSNRSVGSSLYPGTVSFLLCLCLPKDAFPRSVFTKRLWCAWAQRQTEFPDCVRNAQPEKEWVLEPGGYLFRRGLSRGHPMCRLPSAYDIQTFQILSRCSTEKKATPQMRILDAQFSQNCDLVIRACYTSIIMIGRVSLWHVMPPHSSWTQCWIPPPSVPTVAWAW